jgi:hypothetical protein
VLAADLKPNSDKYGSETCWYHATIQHLQSLVLEGQLSLKLYYIEDSHILNLRTHFVNGFWQSTFPAILNNESAKSLTNFGGIIYMELRNIVSS